MFKETRLYSAFRLKCPRCHEGDLFVSKHAYDLPNMAKMPESCPTCGQKYWPEPGFYYGAMYVSYALTIALSVAVFVLMTLFDVFKISWYLGINSLLILILFPPIFRLSRAIWFNFFVGYESPEARAARIQEKASSLSDSKT